MRAPSQTPPTRLTILVALTFGTAACGEDFGQQYRENYNSAFEAICECFPENPVICAFSISESRAECLTETYEASDSATQEVFDCALDALAENAECIDEATQSCDEDAVSVCSDRATDQARACGTIPEATQATLDACD